GEFVVSASQRGRHGCSRSWTESVTARFTRTTPDAATRQRAPTPAEPGGGGPKKQHDRVVWASGPSAILLSSPAGGGVLEEKSDGEQRDADRFPSCGRAADPIRGERQLVQPAHRADQPLAREPAGFRAGVAT